MSPTRPHRPVPANIELSINLDITDINALAAHLQELTSDLPGIDEHAPIESDPLALLSSVAGNAIRELCASLPGVRFDDSAEGHINVESSDIIAATWPAIPSDDLHLSAASAWLLCTIISELLDSEDPYTPDLGGYLHALMTRTGVFAPDGNDWPDFAEFLTPIVAMSVVNVSAGKHPEPVPGIAYDPEQVLAELEAFLGVIADHYEDGRLAADMRSFMTGDQEAMSEALNRMAGLLFPTDDFDDGFDDDCSAASCLTTVEVPGFFHVGPVGATDLLGALGAIIGGLDFIDYDEREATEPGFLTAVQSLAVMVRKGEASEEGSPLTCLVSAWIVLAAHLTANRASDQPPFHGTLYEDRWTQTIAQAEMTLVGWFGEWMELNVSEDAWVMACEEADHLADHLVHLYSLAN